MYHLKEPPLIRRLSVCLLEVKKRRVATAALLVRLHYVARCIQSPKPRSSISSSGTKTSAALLMQ